ncbi:MAG: DUF1015 domain-containing protein [Spirochaetes bacterium]|nr:DUF1015 domain-containing protein [Spirochaetota bacterium]
MVKIKSFKAVHPPKDLYEKVTAPPYDVLSYSDCENLARDNKYSLIHITRSEVDLPKDVDCHSEIVYKKAKENLDMFLNNKYLAQEDSEIFYVYRQVMNGKSQTGFVGCVNAYDYINGIIKKHENTRKDKEEDRIKHIKLTKCQSEPVFLSYKSFLPLNDIIQNVTENSPYIDFTSPDKVRHILWEIKDPSVIQSVVDNFKKLDCLYIADGHHRSAAAVNYALRMDEETNNVGGKEEREYHYFMAVVFPDKDLRIMAYNRAVKDLNNLPEREFIAKISEKFTVKEVSSNDKDGGYVPGTKKEFGMYMSGKWFSVTIKPQYYSGDPILSLSVSILQNNILEPLLGIKDPRTDKRIDFIGGIKGTAYLKSLVDKGEYAVVFSMFPTTMEELFKVSDAGKLMPPKSTWFEPKLLSGITLHKLD